MSKFFKLWVGAFAAAVFLCALSFNVYAADSVSCGENLTYKIENGTLTISGTGAMTNYAFSSTATNLSPFKDDATITALVLGDGVTSIGNSAFYGCSGLKSVTIPSSVETIGNLAFYGCSSLEGLTIPYGVKSIGNSAFNGCSGLTKVTFSDSVESIGNSSFSNCSGLTSITIPGNVKSIGDFTFSSCTGLTSVTISEGVTSIGNYTFATCTGLKKNLIIPSSVTSIGYGTFQNCGYDSEQYIRNLEITVLSTDITFATVSGSNTDAFHNVKEVRCFKNSSTATYASTYAKEGSNVAFLTITYIQDQSAIEAAVPIPTDGKWIQKVELVVTEGGAEKTAELTQYKLGSSEYVFPALIYADRYIGELPCKLRYYYTYENTVISDKTKLTTDTATLSNGNDNKSGGSTVYYKDIPLGNATFTITANIIEEDTASETTT